MKRLITLLVVGILGVPVERLVAATADATSPDSLRHQSDVHGLRPEFQEIMTSCTKPGPGTQPIQLHCPWPFGQTWLQHGGFCPGVGDHCEESKFLGVFPDGWAYDYNLQGTSGDEDCGKDILAAAGGTVTLIGYDTHGWGKFVVIDHGNPGGLHTITRYHHLQSIGDNIDGGNEPTLGSSRNPTVQIRAGDYVGANGGTSGTATNWACHLHFVVDVQNTSGTWSSVDPGAMDGHAVQCNVALTSANSVDDEAPTVTFSGPATGRWYNSDQQLNFTITDTKSNIRGFGQAWDASPPENMFPWATSGFLMLSWAGEGQHTAHVKTRDLSWNLTEGTYGWIGYDVSSPASFSASVTPTTSNANSFSFNWTASSDSRSGLSGYYWSVNGGSETFVAAGVLALSPGAYATQQGANTFNLRAVDNAGNSISAAPVTFTLTSSPCPGREISHSPCVGPSTCYPAMAASLQTLPSISVAQLQSGGAPVRDALKPGTTYSLGFEYKTAAPSDLTIGLGSFALAARDVGVVIGESALPAGDQDWRTFWSAPFSVTADQLQQFGLLRLVPSPASAAGLDLQNVRIVAYQ